MTILFSFCIAVNFSFAQSQIIPYFKNYSDSREFPASVVFSISDDQNGFMWFCTDNGLYRFDGQNYYLYKNDKNDDKSIPQGMALSVHLDRSNRLWVACGSYLCQYNYEMDNFESFKMSDDRGGDYNLNSIFQDQQGILYCCAEPNALFAFDPEKKSSKIFTSIKGETGFPLRIKSGFVDSNNDIWLATYEGVVAFNPISEKYVSFNMFAESNHANGKLGIVNKIIEDPLHPEILLCGTWGNGLVHLNKRTGQMHSSLFQPETPSNLNNIIFDLWPKANNKLWIGTNRIGEFDLKEERFQMYHPAQFLPSEFLDAEVRCIYQDKKNQVWFGTVSGVSVTDPEMNDVVFAEIISSRSGLKEIIFDSKRKYYYSFNVYNDRSLTIFDQHWNELKVFPIPFADELFSEPFHALLYDENTLWIGTTRQGVLVFDLVEQEFVKTDFIWPDAVVESAIYPRYFYKDNNSMVWMCSLKYGLLSYHPSDRTWKIENDKLRIGKSESINLTKVFVDDFARVWCLDQGKGLRVFSLADNKRWQFNDDELLDFFITSGNQ